MKRAFKLFLFEYFFAIVAVVGAAIATSSMASIRDGLEPFLMALVIFVVPVGFIRIFLSYWERGGVAANGFGQWLLRFAYWIPLAYIFHEAYLDYCFADPGRGIILGCCAALVTGAGGAFGIWIGKQKEVPNQPPELGK